MQWLYFGFCMQANIDNPLLYQTPDAWLKTVLENFDTFLQDHAAAEKKAAGMAISMISHYPNRTMLVEAMVDLAIEEMAHYREMIKILHARGLFLTADTKDTYVNQLRRLLRKDSNDYFLDQLLLAAVLEARGAERFGLVANALTDPALKKTYTVIAQSEQRHYALFLSLAQHYFNSSLVEERTVYWLEREAEMMQATATAPRLH